MYDVDNPLLGNDGATHQFGPQKGLQVDDIPVLELEMSTLVSQYPKFSPRHPNFLSRVLGRLEGLVLGCHLQNTRLVPGLTCFEVAKPRGADQQCRCNFHRKERFDSTS